MPIPMLGISPLRPVSGGDPAPWRTGGLLGPEVTTGRFGGGFSLLVSRRLGGVVLPGGGLSSVWRASSFLRLSVVVGIACPLSVTGAPYSAPASEAGVSIALSSWGSAQWS